MRRLGAASLGLTLLYLTIGVLPALAAKANCGSNSFGQNYFGTTRNPSGARSSGAQANIETRESALCAPPSGKVAQAAAFAGLFEVGGNGWAWVGWDRLTGEGRTAVIHVRPTGSLEQRALLFDVALGDSFRYKTSWQNNGDNKIHFIVCKTDGSGCVDFGHTTFDGDVWTDIQGRIVGNTNTDYADIPGIVGNRNDYRQMLWRDGTGPWETLSSSQIMVGPDRYHLNVVDISHIQTWTDPL
jgi:hypothetical protein